MSKGSTQLPESLPEDIRAAYDRMTDAEREPIHYWLCHESSRAETLIQEYINTLSQHQELSVSGTGVVDQHQETAAEFFFRGADTPDEVIERLEVFLWDRDHQGKPRPDEQANFSKLGALATKDTDQGSSATADDPLYRFMVEHLEWMLTDQPIETHPAAAPIRTWWSKPKPVEPYRPRPRAVLANWNTDGDKDRFLLQARQPMPMPEGVQLMLDLPELTPKGSASWLLDLFDRAGGKTMRQGRGAPWDMRLFVGAILHLPIAKRDGQWHTLSLPTNEVIRWLHPDGWHNQTRDWQHLPDALFRMNKELGFVAIQGLGYVQVVGATVIPKEPSDPFVEFTIRIPKTAAYGARLDWQRLCQYGQVSAVLYRAYLAAVDFMHLSAEQGKAVEQAVKGKDGKLRPNPSTRYVRGLTKGELTEMIGLDLNRRNNPGRAIDAFERLADDGVIELVREHNLWRIFGPA